MCEQRGELPTGRIRIALLSFLLICGQVCLSEELEGSPSTAYGHIKRGSVAEEGHCRYNGSLYSSGDYVKTGEPCLNCTCTRSYLICYLRVCPQVPLPPPQGCIILHKKDVCCPQLVCSEDNGIHPEDLLSRHSRPQDEEDDNQSEPAEKANLEDAAHEKNATTTNDKYEKKKNTAALNSQPKGCKINGTIYAEGSAMLSSTQCEYCYCMKGKQHCAKPNCILQLAGCTPIFRKHTCCPVKYNCTALRNVTIISSSTSMTPSPTIITKIPTSSPVTLPKFASSNSPMLLSTTSSSTEQSNIDLTTTVLPEEEETTSTTIEANVENNSTVYYRTSVPEKNQNILSDATENISTIPSRVDIPSETASAVPAILTASQTFTEEMNTAESVQDTTTAIVSTTSSTVDEGWTTVVTKMVDQFLYDSTRDIMSGAITEPQTIEPEYSTLAEEHLATSTTGIYNDLETTTFNAADSTEKTIDNVPEINILADSNKTKYSSQTERENYSTTANNFYTEHQTYHSSLKETSNDITTADTTEKNSPLNNDSKTETFSAESIGTISVPEFTSRKMPDSSSEVKLLMTTSSSTEKQPLFITETLLPSASEQTTTTTEVTRNQLQTTENQSQSADKRSDSRTNNSTFSDLLNVNIKERSTVSSTSPANPIPPEIEAILNITKSNEHSDYELDYDEPTLPPSLPNLKIIPFVAADALDQSKDETIQREEELRPFPTAIEESGANYQFSSAPQVNQFSPPIETEGGFIPKEPTLDGPYFESKYVSLYQTTENLLKISKQPSSSPKPSTPVPKDACITENHVIYKHGELISEPKACNICVCLHGNSVCQEPECPPIEEGCQRIKTETNNESCCGEIICEPTTDSLKKIPPVPALPTIYPIKPVINEITGLEETNINPELALSNEQNVKNLPEVSSSESYEEHSTASEHSSRKPPSFQIPTHWFPSEENYLSQLDKTPLIGNPVFNLKPEKDKLDDNESLSESDNESISNEKPNQFHSVYNINYYRPSLETDNSPNSKQQITSNEAAESSKDDNPNTTPNRNYSTTEQYSSSENDNDYESGISLENVFSFLLDEPINKETFVTTTVKPSTVPKATEHKTLSLPDNHKLITKTEITIDRISDTDDTEDPMETANSVHSIVTQSSKTSTEAFSSTNKPLSTTETSLPQEEEKERPDQNTPVTPEQSQQDTALMHNPLVLDRVNTLSKLPNLVRKPIVHSGPTRNPTIASYNPPSPSKITVSPLINDYPTKRPAIVGLPIHTLENNSDSNRNRITPTVETSSFKADGNEDGAVVFKKKQTPSTILNVKSTSSVSNTLTTTPKSNSAVISADPGAASGLLKLSGCNIFGKMYKVGKIITELSSPCLQCMCTDVGVQCNPLKC